VFVLAGVPRLLDVALARLHPPAGTLHDPLVIAALLAWIVAVAVTLLRPRAGAARWGRGDSSVTIVEAAGRETYRPDRDASGIGPIGPTGRYRLTRELGRGGMGVVYHALDTVLEREVALKELPLHLGAKSDVADRFRQEARVLAKLSHPAIVQVYDLIEDQGRLWIALEYVRGGSLADSMKLRGGWLPWAEAARLGRQIAEGLAFAHEQGVVHRDIKPLNVLLTDGRPPTAKLTDFGLAKLAESTEHTQPGSVLGSARYMSPEQAQGRPADARSDLYALGVTFYEVLTGAVPFDGEFAAVLARQIYEAPPDVRARVPEVPEAMASLVAALLEKDPANRPVDAHRVAFALAEIVSRDEPLDHAA
jgi:serine/threonine-protein kinase